MPLCQCAACGCGFRTVERLRFVGIAAQNHSVSRFSRDLPEQFRGIMPSLIQAKQIDLQRNPQFLHAAAKAGHLPSVGCRLSRPAEQIRVGQIGEFPGGKAFQHLRHILNQHRFIHPPGSGVDPIPLIVDIVLSHDHVFTGKLLQEVQKILKISGIILRFHADTNINLTGVFPLQIGNRAKIVLRLLRRHAEIRHITIGKRVGRVVGKPKDLHTAGNGLFHIFPLRSGRMAAPPGMGMIIGAHNRPPLFARSVYHVCLRFAKP